jgi:hypothetical protein
MKEYNPTDPLIAIHIPKTGGTSVRNLFNEWFGSGFLSHYKSKHSAPKRHDLSSIRESSIPIVIYGHFNQLRNFGIAQYYPEVNQFITMIRDPFERAISRYFYNSLHGKCNKKIEDTLMDSNPELSALCHFPEMITLENYKDVIESSFVEIGIMERMEESLRRISRKLNKAYKPLSVQHLNISARNSPIPYGLREEWEQRNSLECLVYKYVLDKYN